MNTLIIGGGEIGQSLNVILSKEYKSYMYDIKTHSKDSDILHLKDVEIMHICFPYSDKFIKYVNEYQKRFNPKYTVIHSTVPVGTSRTLKAIHSPVVGIHPHLSQSLKTFTKFLSGEHASEVANYFRRAGMKVYITDRQETTELCKIQSTTFYSLCIEFFKDMKNQCDSCGVPFEFWTLWNQNYNQGYEKLACPEYTRPNLVPIMTRQKGHCTLPNLELLDTQFTKFIKTITL